MRILFAQMRIWRVSKLSISFVFAATEKSMDYSFVWVNCTLDFELMASS